MKSNKMMARFVAGLALAVGAFFVTPHAEALNTTSKKVATASVSTTAHYTFILGLDGNIWYTLSSSVGSTLAKTGNANNPFDLSGVSFGAGGFVTTGSGFCSGGTVVNSTTVRGTCSQEWVKFPGAANFNDAPQASIFGPIAATTNASIIAASAATIRSIFPFLPGSSQILINVLAPGLDGNVWYTLVDGTGNNGSTTAMNGSALGSLSASDPFALTGEDSDSGFVSTSSSTGLVVNCVAAIPSRTCTGIWAPYP